MKVKYLMIDGEEFRLARGEQIVVELSERNVASLYHQGKVSASAGPGDQPRKVYGSLLKTFDDGPRMVVHVVPNDEHYDEDGIAR